MAVAIRLRREGNRNRAFYRIVVADSRARRDGRFIETLGTYDPNDKGTNYKVDVVRADDWISKGAQPSDTVRSILKKARKEAPATPEEASPAAEAPAEPAPAEEPKVEAEAAPAPAEEPKVEAEAAPAAEEPAAEAEPEAEAQDEPKSEEAADKES